MHRFCKEHNPHEFSLIPARSKLYDEYMEQCRKDKEACDLKNYNELIK